jgi:hypothetical protein
MIMQKTRTAKQDKPAIAKYHVFGLQYSLHPVNTDEKETSATIYQIGEGEKAARIYSDVPVTITVDYSKKKKGKAEISSRLALQGILITGICPEEVSYKQTQERRKLDEFALRDMESYHPRFLELLENGGMTHYDRATHIFYRPGADEGQHFDRNENGIYILQAA